MSGARRAPRSLALPIGVSALLHAAVVVPLILVHPPPVVLTPPMYRVNLVAAPAGPRAVGVVTDAPPPPEPPKPAAKAPPKAVAKAPPVKATKAPKPSKAAVDATPSVKPPPVEPKPAEAPRAGAGNVGGKGNDVIQLDNEGIAFPYPGYLANIVRQIAQNFSPKGNVGALRAEVSFLIRRDGSITAPLLLTRSGNKAFDLEALGAVEAAAHSFGVLPPTYSEDALPIIFLFDPARLK